MSRSISSSVRPAAAPMQHVLAPLVVGLAAPPGPQDEELAFASGQATGEQLAAERQPSAEQSGMAYEGGEDVRRRPADRRLGQQLTSSFVLLVGAEGRDPGRRWSGCHEPDSRRGRDVRSLLEFRAAERAGGAPVGSRSGEQVTFPGGRQCGGDQDTSLGTPPGHRSGPCRIGSVGRPGLRAHPVPHVTPSQPKGVAAVNCGRPIFVVRSNDLGRACGGS